MPLISKIALKVRNMQKQNTIFYTIPRRCEKNLYFTLDCKSKTCQKNTLLLKLQGLNYYYYYYKDML